jgi:hypothetical protein
VLIRRLIKGVPTRSRRGKSKKWKETLTSDMMTILYRYHKVLLTLDFGGLDCESGQARFRDLCEEKIHVDARTFEVAIWDCFLGVGR